MWGSMLADPTSLLKNRQAWGIEPPLLLLTAHNDNEAAAADEFRSGPARDLARFATVRQDGHIETVGHAIELFRREFQADADPFTAKRQSLFLTRPVVPNARSTVRAYKY